MTVENVFPINTAVKGRMVVYDIGDTSLQDSKTNISKIHHNDKVSKEISLDYVSYNVIRPSLQEHITEMNFKWDVVLVPL